MPVRYQFFIKKQKVSGTPPSAPALQLSVLCSTTATLTGATGFKTATHVYFVKEPSPTAGDPHHTAGNIAVGFTDKLDTLEQASSYFSCLALYLTVAWTSNVLFITNIVAYLRSIDFTKPLKWLPQTPVLKSE